ncbi:MAG: MBL fold metallo-hydrolase [Lachnospiraceae bacterium]|jgi:L-ascorbate metabolism protein UlaG (beta-lactamase superfamily)|nr:MBL fold metallo-hydrolase [Lachnospiraceae bacterium]
MQITYIGHSGFLVELKETLLLFDYYEGTLPKFPHEKKLYVFASHRHPDHFNPEIFSLAQEKGDTLFILSHDIWECRVPKELRAQTVRLKPNESYSPGNITVRTLKSTDEGVAFLVECEGKTIYHAGDLNDWRWIGEPENWNRQMAENYRSYIEPLRDLQIDAAFIPLDPRQEDYYALGMDYFLSLNTQKGEHERIYPMHCWEDYSIIDRWLREHPEHPDRDRIVRIQGRGEMFRQ